MAPKDDKSDPSHLRDIPRERTEERPDFSQPLPRKPLRKELLERLETNEKESWSSIYEGEAPESTESNVRYAAYASRVRTILLSAHRYVAYTSDIGESFRPIAHPYLIKGAYAVSWIYLAGDVSHEGYKAWLKNQKVLHPENFEAHEKAEGVVDKVKEKVGELQSGIAAATGGQTALVPGKVAAIDDYRTVMVQRAVFQGLASMGLPAFTIHSLVKYSGIAMKNVKSPKIRTWGPIGLGLAAVPALPYMFDEPVEHATEYVFHKTFELLGGPSAVGHKSESVSEAVKKAIPEKEL